MEECERLVASGSEGGGGERPRSPLLSPQSAAHFMTRQKSMTERMKVNLLYLANSSI